MILIPIASVIVTGIIGYAALEIAKLKYRETAELGDVKAEVAALRKELKSINTKDFNDRLITLENRAGVRMF